MKIAIINTEYPTIGERGNGGITSYTITISSLLSEMGHTVYLFSREGFKYEQSFLDQVKPYFFGYKKSKIFFARFLEKFSDGKIKWEKGMARGLILQLKEVWKKERFDIIEVPEYGGVGYYFKKYIDIPYVVTFHTPSKLVDLLNKVKITKINKALYWMEELTIKNASAFKSPSIAMKNWCVNHYKIEPSRISVIPNPFVYKPYISMTKGKKSSFNILFVGRLEPRKGISIILNTINELLSISPEIRFIFAGATVNGFPDYRKMITEKVPPDYKKRIIFTGPVMREKIIRLYQDASLVIIPSLFENFPYVLLEAMASSLPVIVSSNGGMKEIIVDGENGFTFELSNPNELIEKTKRVFFSPDLSLQLGLNAANTIKRRLNPYHIVNEHINFYKMVIKEKSKQCSK